MPLARICSIWAILLFLTIITQYVETVSCPVIDVILRNNHGGDEMNECHKWCLWLLAIWRLSFKYKKSKHFVQSKLHGALDLHTLNLICTYYFCIHNILAVCQRSDSSSVAKYELFRWKDPGSIQAISSSKHLVACWERQSFAWTPTVCQSEQTV